MNSEAPETGFWSRLRIFLVSLEVPPGWRDIDWGVPAFAFGEDKDNGVVLLALLVIKAMY